MATDNDPTPAHERSAPDPDSRSKPDNPAEMHKASWGYTMRRAVQQFGRDHCTDLAAGLTFHAVLSVFPAMLALVSLLGVFGEGEQTVNTVMSTIQGIAPAAAMDQLRPTVEHLVNARAAGLGLVAGILVALWSASGYVAAFGRAMNRVYGITEGRPIWKLRPQQLLFTALIIVLLLLVSLGLVVSGPVARSVGNTIGIGSAALTVWGIAKWPVMLAVVVLIVALLYYVTPNVQQPKFRWLGVGSVLAIVTWVVASVLFGVYVSNFSNYNKTYGTLGGAIIFLLWLWITNLALLFGAEVEAELERSRELQGGIVAEREIRLPPRDTQASVKAAVKEEELVAHGRRLRLDSEREQSSEDD